ASLTQSVMTANKDPYQYGCRYQQNDAYTVFGILYHRLCKPTLLILYFKRFNVDFKLPCLSLWPLLAYASNFPFALCINPISFLPNIFPNIPALPDRGLESISHFL